jgi:hypothetical protein
MESNLLERVLIVVISVALIVIFNILEHFGFLTKDSRLWHAADAVIRIVEAGLCSYIIFMGFSLKMYTLWVLLLLIYWLLFDMGRNIKHKMPLFYVGKTAWTDKVFRKITRSPDLPMLMVKLVSISIFICLMTMNY